MIHTPGTQPSVWAIIPAFNRGAKTLRFISNFRTVDYPEKHIVVVDDGSSDYTRFNIALNFPDVHVLTGNGNLWWSGATNAGIRYAIERGADYILTINDDGLIAPDFLTRLVSQARADPRRIVGCCILREDQPDIVWSVGSRVDLSQPYGLALNFAGCSWSEIGPSLPDFYPVDFMAGNGVLIPVSVFRDVGLYDEVNLPQYHADSDLVLRAARAGYRNGISTRSIIYNHINTVPLVNNRFDLLYSKKSDLYYHALRTFYLRNFPSISFRKIAYRAYARFILPRWLYKVMHKLSLAH